jgi:demethylmenaquinone methyltransferase/2-methoxy-6-polyprenyl-1,4-benzoquinol methylase
VSAPGPAEGSDVPPGGSAPSDSAGQQSRAGNEVPESNVASMFDRIAPVYDRMNTIMTAGLDGRWRRAAVKATRLVAGGSALDVACGTGKLTCALACVAGPSGRAVGLDLAPVMLEEARRACGEMANVEFVEGNALCLPFEAGTFDAATIAFGLRNLSSFGDGFAEMARVVRPGGRVVCLELSNPRPKILGRFYRGVFGVMAPTVGSLFGQRAAYAYLPHSLEGFPSADELAETMRQVGLREVAFKRLGLGAVALHVGVVPPR